MNGILYVLSCTWYHCGGENGHAMPLWEIVSSERTRMNGKRIPEQKIASEPETVQFPLPLLRNVLFLGARLTCQIHSIQDANGTSSENSARSIG